MQKDFNGAEEINLELKLHILWKLSSEVKCVEIVNPSVNVQLDNTGILLRQ